MTEQASEKPTAEGDLKEVAKLHKQGKLGQAVARLDADDVRGTLEAVPAAVVRLLGSLLPISNVDDEVKKLPRNQRTPAEALLRSARKYDAKVFVTALLREISGDPTLRERLGIKLPDTARSRDMQVENTITSLVTRPQFLLQSSRVYCEIAFMQEDRLLLRSAVEVDSLVTLARSMLEGANKTLCLLRENAKGTEPIIDLARCNHELKRVRKVMRELPQSLSAVLKKADKAKTKRAPRAKK